MAIAKFVQIGQNIDYTAEADVAYREIVPLISRVGVACEAIPKGESGTLSLTGVYEMPAVSGAIAVGATVYYDTETEKITVTKKEDTTVLAGIAVAAKTEAGTSCLVRIG